MALVFVLLALCSIACEDDTEELVEAALDASFDGGAEAGIDAGGDVGLLDATLRPDAGDADTWPPAQPTSFRIAVSGGTCEGGCPVFSLELDHTGRVSFFGTSCTARPGAFTKQIAAADARALYAALAATAYWTLADRYLSLQDGCPETALDHRTLTWNVEVDGRAKRLEHYRGCNGLPELDQIAALEPLARRLSGVEPWIHPSLLHCGIPSLVPPSGFELYPSYRLSHGHQTLGLLTLMPYSSSPNRSAWVLGDCSGTRLQSGQILLDADGWVLLDGAKRPITLPAGLGEVGSIVLEKPVGDTPPRVRALRADDELELTATPGSGC